MSQPVKLSDSLILEARLAAEAQERSIAGQVEYWAKLGRSVSDLISGRVQQRLVHRELQPLSELVSTAATPDGQARLKDHLESQPFPHFEAHPSQKGLLIRTDADGRKTIGRFKNRRFVEVADRKTARRATALARSAASRAR